MNICFILALTPSQDYSTGVNETLFSFFSSFAFACLTAYCVTLKIFADLVIYQQSRTIA